MATSFFFIQKFLSLHFLAGMLKLVDKQDLGSCASCVWVRVPLPAQGDRFGKRRSFFCFHVKAPGRRWRFLPSEWSPGSDTGRFSSQETQNGHPEGRPFCLRYLYLQLDKSGFTYNDMKRILTLFAAIMLSVFQANAQTGTCGKPALV